jgi:hypothetical protein
VPTVTGLREDRRGRVAVELDGSPWRTLPAGVVVRAGISCGRALDRQALRKLRRELRRAEALAVAGRALRARDLSARELALRLEQRAVSPSAAEESLAALSVAGLVDDARLAENRAESLAGRGYGDAAIRHDLEQRGVKRPWRPWSLRASGRAASLPGVAPGRPQRVTWPRKALGRRCWNRLPAAILDTTREPG